MFASSVERFHDEELGLGLLAAVKAARPDLAALDDPEQGQFSLAEGLLRASMVALALGAGAPTDFHLMGFAAALAEYFGQMPATLREDALDRFFSALATFADDTADQAEGAGPDTRGHA